MLSASLSQSCSLMTCQCDPVVWATSSEVESATSWSSSRSLMEPSFGALFECPIGGRKFCPSLRNLVRTEPPPGLETSFGRDDVGWSLTASREFWLRRFSRINSSSATARRSCSWDAIVWAISSDLHSTAWHRTSA